MSAPSSALRGLRDLGGRRLSLHELCEARKPVGAVPEQALDLDEEVVGEAPKPLLGAELEEGVGLEPSLLGVSELPCRDRALEPVERGRDDVEVGGGARIAPLVRIQAVDQGERFVGRRRYVVRIRDGVVARSRAQIRRERVEKLAEPAGVRLVLEREQMLEVAEGLRGSVAEGHGLLDLEVEPHLAVLDAAPVFDRDEGQEPLQLARAPELLVLGERSRPEALQACLDVLEGGRDRCVVAGLGRRDELVEGCGGACCLRGRPLVGVGGGEHREVSAGERGAPGAADVEPLVAGG